MTVRSQTLRSHCGRVIAGAVILIAASGVGVGVDRPSSVEALGVASNQSWWPLGDGISGAIPGDHFGASVDISPDGTVVVAGSPKADSGGADSGQVRIFDWTSDTWQVRSTFDGEAGEELGTAVALSDDALVLAIAAPRFAGGAGRIQVHEWTGSAWIRRGGDLIGAPGDELGAVALDHDGDTLVVGNGADTTTGPAAGSVTIYDWDNGSWAVRGDPLYGATDDRFGSDVAVTPDGDTIVVGAPGNGLAAPVPAGSVRVFDFESTSWHARGPALTGVNPGDQYGSSVDVSDDGLMIAVGAWGVDAATSGEGEAEVHLWTGTAWVQQGATLVGANGDDQLGAVIRLSGDGTTVAVSSPGWNSVSSGAADIGRVAVYDWEAASAQWVQRAWDLTGVEAGDAMSFLDVSYDGATVAVARLGADAFTGIVDVYSTTTLAPWGSAISGAEPFARLGSSTAMDADGDTLVVGSPRLDVGSIAAGTVTVYRRSQSVWNQLGQALHGVDLDDLFGAAVDINATGDVIAVGAPQASNGTDRAGAVSVYEFDGTDWVMTRPRLLGSAAGENFAASVALDATGDVLALGIPDANPGGRNQAGAAAVWDWDGASWSLRSFTEGAVAGDGLGAAVALDADGDVLALGAPLSAPGGRILAGAVTVSVWNGAAWVPRTALTGTSAGDRLGSAVALDADGDVVATGSPGYETGLIIGPILPAAQPVRPALGPDSGQVHVRRWTGATWEQMGDPLMLFAGGSELGARLALDASGSVMAMAAPGFDNGVTVDAGMVDVMRFDGEIWQHVTPSILGSAVGVQAGSGLSMSGDGRIIAVGSPLANGTGVLNGEIQIHRVNRVATPLAPGAVTALSVSDRSVELAWTRGPVDINDPITGSVIEHSIDGGRSWNLATWATLDPTGTLVTGLDPATTYLLRVRDVNATGAGAATITTARTASSSLVPPPPMSRVEIALGETSILEVTGSDVYELAAALSQVTYPQGAQRVYLTTARTFADAATSGAIDSSARGPVLVTATDELSLSTRRELERLEPHTVVIIGEIDVVSTAVERDLERFPDVQIERLGGADRYETAAAIARDRYPAGVSTVVVVDGTRHGDAVIAAPLAATLGAPILLTGPRNLPDVTRDALRDLRAEEVIVVGGTRSVSEGVVETLRSHGLEIERIAGDDRTSTAGAIARRMTPSRGTDLVVVDGYREGEALAVGAAASRLGAAVVYTSGSCRTSATREIIDWWEPDRILLVATRAHLAQTLTAVSRDCDTEL